MSVLEPRATWCYREAPAVALEIPQVSRLRWLAAFQVIAETSSGIKEDEKSQWDLPSGPS